MRVVWGGVLREGSDEAVTSGGAATPAARGIGLLLLLLLLLLLHLLYGPVPPRVVAACVPDTK